MGIFLKGIRRPNEETVEVEYDSEVQNGGSELITSGASLTNVNIASDDVNGTSSLICTETVYDTDGYVNENKTGFIAPTDGLYLVEASGVHFGGIGLASVVLNFSNNGPDMNARVQDNNPGLDDNLSLSQILRLQTGEEVDGVVFWTGADAGITITMGMMNGNAGSFSIVKLGDRP